MKKQRLAFGVSILAIWFCQLHAQENSQALIDPVTGQQPCGTPAPPAEWHEWFNKKVEEYKEHEAHTKTQQATYTIPVIIHVVHAGESVGTFPNLTNAQLVSQLAVMNADYSGKGYNSSSAPSIWKSLVADAGVQFCLALKDPNGNTLAEPGIERIDYKTKSGWKDPKSGSAGSNNSAFISYIDNTIKPGSIWDPVKYLNMWVTDRPSDGTGLGVALFPPGTNLPGSGSYVIATNKTDGLWCWGKCFGTTGTLASGYDKGRVASHEIGHYLGLVHTWGSSTCGTDYCNDTPVQSAANFGCPTFPANQGKCSGNTTGEMTMNIMDYTNDACKYMFTPDQVTRIQTAMSQSPNRKLLGTHNLCSSTISTEDKTAETENNLTMYPNPGHGISTLQFSAPEKDNYMIELVDFLGRIVYQVHISEFTGKYSGQMNLSEYKQGVYTLILRDAYKVRSAQKVMVY